MITQANEIEVGMIFEYTLSNEEVTKFQPTMRSGSQTFKVIAEFSVFDPLDQWRNKFYCAQLEEPTRAYLFCLDPKLYNFRFQE